MARMPPTATGAVNTETSIVYVIFSRVVSSSDGVVWVQLLQEQGAEDTLSYMQTYWVDIHGKNEHFWEVWQA